MTATTEIRDLGRAWANDPRTVALTRPAREKLFAWAEGWVQKWQPPCEQCGSACPSQGEFIEDDSDVVMYRLCSGCDDQLDWEGGEYTRRDVVLALALELGVPEDAAWALCKQSMGWSDE